LASISRGSLKTATKLKAESIMWQNNNNNNNNSPNLATFFLQHNWNIVRIFHFNFAFWRISPEKKENAATHYKGFL
jgi:hypothetical protein